MHEVSLNGKDFDYNQLIQDLKETQTLSERLEVMYKLLNDIGFYNRVLIIAGNGRFEYGIDIVNPAQANTIGRFLLKKQCETRYKHSQKIMVKRLDELKTTDEKIQLIREEIKYFQGPVSNIQTVISLPVDRYEDKLLMSYANGYLSEKRKSTPDFLPQLDRTFYEQTERGVINCRLENFLKSELEKLSGQISTSSNNNTNAAPAKSLTQNVIALKYYYLCKSKEYEEWPNEAIMTSVGKEYGWTAKNSGIKILRHFQNYNSDPAKITSVSDGKKRINARIANIEAVIPELNEFPKALRIAEGDLLQLEFNSK